MKFVILMSHFNFCIMKKFLPITSAYTLIFFFLYGCSPVRIYSDPDLTRRSGLKYYTAYLQVEKDQLDNIVKAAVTTRMKKVEF